MAKYHVTFRMYLNGTFVVEAETKQGAIKVARGRGALPDQLGGMWISEDHAAAVGLAPEQKAEEDLGW